MRRERESAEFRMWSVDEDVECSLFLYERATVRLIFIKAPFRLPPAPRRFSTVVTRGDSKLDKVMSKMRPPSERRILSALIISRSHSK